MLKGAFKIVALLCFMWAVKTPPTVGCPGWCLHQPATILNSPKLKVFYLFAKYLPEPA
jgi:hypothetical protein